MPNSVLRVDDLLIRYRKQSMFSRRPEPAVCGVSFDLRSRQTLGIVGESGSGKTTVLNAILRLIPVESGTIQINGEDWLALKPGDMRMKRARIGVVGQNPFLSLSPRFTVAQILAEPMLSAESFSRREIEQRSQELLSQCGLPADYLKCRAIELSGGQAQRVAIARALALKPTLMILDEPTSALDVSVQAQVLNLLCDLKDQLGLSMLFVTHDLHVVRYMSDNLLVMRHGDCIEYGPTDQVIASPVHEYTRELLHA